MNASAPLLNSRQRNAELVLEIAIDALATTTGITGQVRAFQPRNEHGSGADAELELSVDGRSYRYLVEIKHIDRMAMLHQVKQRFAEAPCPCLLVAPRMSAELAGKCRDIGVQFIDADGNAYLQAPGMLVFVKGQRPSKDGALNAALSDGVRAVGPSALRLAFVLLCAPELLNAPYRVLSQAAGVSLGAIGAIIQDLARRGYINHAKSGRRFLEKNRLMNEWVTMYPIVLRPKLAARRFRALERDWWKSVDIGQFDAAWGGEVAADQLTGYLKPEKITIYMHSASMRQNLGKLVIQNKLRADPDGDIEILEKFWELPQIDKATPASVPPLLAYADLVASMEPRNLEVATMIYQDLKNAN
ncbi:type IV toxin-antitoxin system AbiEi family antitoxin [Massilia sp. DJPM01]|uniref:type IV toxin-antitoxin system AbiEi family antitoxin n=1 Tax=Massilia sp. DJPM01 TaxID=3024404 RepID=UPI00259FA478|nr:type IV toxin-antitoxin system AbiEi family antitoxin [Massilia sp. DJPM01]MDM5179104.1 type IV toxin-antitoxin system AbiEi family antitoxin [Massilia sp. DJPM01]